MHRQIEEEEIVERYARNQLAPEEREAFEEHFFTCDECFEKLQATERFIAGVRNATARGLLGSGSGAIALLEQANERRSIGVLMLKSEPVFDPLRSQPRFLALLKKAGLEN